MPIIAFLCLIATASSFSKDVDPTGVYWGTFVSCIVGFALGLLVKKVLPRIAEDGRLIWVLPSILLTMVFCSELFRKDLAHALKEFFFPGGEGEEDLLFVLATLPTYSCIAYSIAASSHLLNFLRRSRGNPAQ